MCVEYTAQAKNINQNSSSFTVSGRCGEDEIVKAKIDLRHFNLGDENTAYTKTDAEMIEKLRLRLRLLTQNSQF